MARGYSGKKVEKSLAPSEVQKRDMWMDMDDSMMMDPMHDMMGPMHDMMDPMHDMMDPMMHDEMHQMRHMMHMMMHEMRHMHHLLKKLYFCLCKQMDHDMD